MKNAPGMNLGDCLRRERESRHWTQEDLAHQIGVSTLSLLRWEKGQFKPSKYALQKLVELFGPVENWGGGRVRVWTVPYFRNLYFTGRERILTRLSKSLSEQSIVAMSQVGAVSGLGGIGKTQTAIEYAYRYADRYDVVLWVRADSRETLIAQFAGLAFHLGLPNQTDADHHRLAKAVKRWLEEEEGSAWLLIFDNVEDIQMVKEFLPMRGKGAALLTTRLHAVGKHIHKIELDKLSREEGILFLQSRISAGGEQGPVTLLEAEQQAAEQLYTLMDGLPLALDQAAAYIEEHRCTLAEYLVLYQQQQTTLLRLRNKVDVEDYPDSVATTWLLSFQRIEVKNPAAAELLRLCAFLAPDAISEEILTKGASLLGSILAPIAGKAAQLNQAIETLRASSLVRRDLGEKTFSLHRLVQAVLQDKMETAERRMWAERALRAVNAVFPHSEYSTWPQCERLLSHALSVTSRIETEQIGSEEAGHLLYNVASYLQDHARYQEAEPLYQHALRVQKQQLGSQHPEVATVLNSLAILYRSKGKYTEAEPLHREALHIFEEQLGSQHSKVAMVLNGLANLSLDQGKYAEAGSFYQRALAICEKQLGPQHPEVAMVLNGLAILFYGQGKYAEAEPLYLRALHIWEQKFEPQRPDMAYPLHGLALLYAKQGKHAEAESLYLRALHIWEQEFGLQHLNVTATLNCLGCLYRDQGKYAEAEQFHLRSLHIMEEHLEPEHPLKSNPLNDLANLYRDQGKYKEAELLYLRALHIREQQLGPEHPETVETMYDLAQFRVAQGNHEKAKSWCEQTLETGEQAR
jgi:tetratricopeptide (TPR) repeat protein/transcriptional regulator with XRE-family HTH domain